LIQHTIIAATTSVNLRTHAQIFSGPKEGMAYVGMFDKMASNGKRQKSVSFPKNIDKL